MSDKKIVKSIRGEAVDFDRLRLEINEIPESETVRYRENLIQGRRKRKSSNRKVREMLREQNINEANIRKAIEKRKEQIKNSAVDANKPVLDTEDATDIKSAVSQFTTETEGETTEEKKSNRRVKR